MKMSKISAKQRGRQMVQRILTSLANEPQTVAELSARFNTTVSNMSLYIKRLRDAVPRQVYISSFNSNTGKYAGRPAPVYAAGSKPNAEFVPLRRPTPKKSVAERCEQVLAHLLQSPLSSVELAAKMFVVRDTALSYLTKLRREGKIHITRWAHPSKFKEGRGGSYTPIYAIGSKADKPRPKKESSAARNARKRKEPGYAESERKRAAKRRAIIKFSKKPQSIFAALGL